MEGVQNQGFKDELGYYPYENGKAPTTNGGPVDAERGDPPPYSEKDDKQIEIEEEDPWKVTSIPVNYTPWSELKGKQKLLRFVGYCVKVVLVIACLYMFICSLDFLSSAFKLLGGETAGKVFQQNDILSNPVAGLMMGVLVTVLVQSSSTSTSIIISMVGANLLDIDTSIPIVMGANIGTSVTNTIVAVGQIADKGEFRRAFAGATVHDMFNWLAVIVLLPIEIATGYLHRLSGAVVDSLPLETNKEANKDILKVVTKPFTELIIQVNKNAIKKIAQNKHTGDETMLKLCCDKTTPEKCCNKDVGDLVGKSISHAYTMRQATCDSVSECVKESPTASQNASCLSTPWNYASSTCTDFKGSEAQLSCCIDTVSQASWFGSGPSSLQVKQTCSAIGSCYTSGDHSFSMKDCTDGTRWGPSMNVTSDWGKDFCKSWTTQVVNTTCNKPCDYLFKNLYPDLDDKAIGAILLVISLAILCGCLVGIVKLLHSLLKGPIAIMIKKFVNAEFPGKAAYFTGYLAILLGAGLTFVVQSSSIFTSTLTPLVGIGVIELDRMYPLTLGANIGTTTTGILSALAQSGKDLKPALQVAFCHLFFNISGILIFSPSPFSRPPIPLAKFLGNCTADYRWFAIVYIIFMFFLLPAAIFGLSVPGWYVLAAVLIPIVVIVIAVAIIKGIQYKKPEILPRKLQNWKFLPKFMRSLESYDRFMSKLFFCKRFQSQKSTEEQSLDPPPPPRANGVENPALNSYDNTRL